MGVGSMTLLSSPTVGVTVAMPTAGSIPTASGLDGVLPGWPWDAALVNQWRLITVVNQGSTGVRTLLIDGHEASSTTASVATIPAATVLSVCPASAVTLAEFMVWNTASITADQLASQAGCILGPLKYTLFASGLLANQMGCAGASNTDRAAGRRQPRSQWDETQLRQLARRPSQTPVLD